MMMRNENAITNVVHVALKGILFKFKIIKNCIPIKCRNIFFLSCCNMRMKEKMNVEQKLFNQIE
jgi:hypothetical protein